MDDSPLPPNLETTPQAQPPTQNNTTAKRTIWNLIKPTPGKIVILFLLFILKQLVPFLVAFLSSFKNPVSSFFMVALIDILHPKIALVSFFNLLWSIPILKIVYILFDPVYLYSLSLILYQIFRFIFPHRFHAFPRKVYIFLIIILIISLTFPLLFFLPTINKFSSENRTINYLELSKPSYHVKNLQSGITDINSLPTIRLVELWSSSNNSAIIPIDKVLDRIFPVVLASMITPSYIYSVSGNQVILESGFESEVSCKKIAGSGGIIIASGWDNELVYPQNFPQEFEEYSPYIDKMRIQIKSFNPDGSVTISTDKNPNVVVLPNQEYIEKYSHTGLLSGREEYFGIRNFGNSKTQCFPEHMPDSVDKEQLFIDTAKKESDESYCTQISSNAQKHECYDTVYLKYIEDAKSSKDESLCKKIDLNIAPDMYSKCLEKVAAVTNNSYLCSSIPDSSPQAQIDCFQATSTLNTCSAISDANERENCYWGTHYCEYLNKKPQQDLCYTVYMNEIWPRFGYEKSQTICDNITPNTIDTSTILNRGSCYQTLAIGVALTDADKALKLVKYPFWCTRFLRTLVVKVLELDRGHFESSVDTGMVVVNDGLMDGFN